MEIETVSCSPGCPPACCGAEAGLELRIPLPVLELPACATVGSSVSIFKLAPLNRITLLKSHVASTRHSQTHVASTLRHRWAGGEILLVVARRPPP